MTGRRRHVTRESPETGPDPGPDEKERDVRMQRERLQRLHIRLSKVILLRDACSEEAVTSGLRIRVLQDGRKPAAKPGGYWMFLDMGQDEFEIEIESPIYQNKKVRLKPDQGEEVEEIFLSPSSAYPVRPGHTMIRGTAGPGTVLRFHLEEGMPEGRLIHDCKKGDLEISVFIRDTAGLRRKWYMRDREKQTGEYVRIRDFSEDLQQCRLLQPLKAGYRKKDTAIYQAYECTADEDGEFCLLLDGLKARKYRLYCSYMEEGKAFCKEAEFEGKKQTRI